MNCYINHEKKLCNKVIGYHETNRDIIKIGINLKAYWDMQTKEKKRSGLDVIDLCNHINDTFLIECLCQFFEIENINRFRRKNIYKPFKECKRCRPERCVNFINSKTFENEQWRICARRPYILENILRKLNIALYIFLLLMSLPTWFVMFNNDIKTTIFSFLVYLLLACFIYLLHSIICWKLYKTIIELLASRFEQM